MCCQLRAPAVTLTQLPAAAMPADEALAPLGALTQLTQLVLQSCNSITGAGTGRVTACLQASMIRLGGAA